MKPLLLTAMILQAAVLLAQPGPSFTNQQQTTGVVGLAPGQTARFTVLYPTVPAPILQVICSATVAIVGEDPGAFKTVSVPQLFAGRSASVDLNADTDLAGRGRVQIHGNSISPNGCQLVGTLEIIDNATQKTVVVVGSRTTFPFAQTPAPAITLLPTNGGGQ